MDKFVIVFIEDILIYSRSNKEHEEHLKLILELLKKEELYANFSKCEFWLPKVQFLSHVIDSQGLGVVLIQKEKVIAYASRQLKVHEKNYTTHDLKLGALATHFDQKDLNMIQRRWLELLSDYDREIRYHPRKANVVENALTMKWENISEENLYGMNKEFETCPDGTLCIENRS
ncbi:retrotransposon protein, putative, ty3-gypsy subclass [Tanacetum coccineum]